MTTVKTPTLGDGDRIGESVHGAPPRWVRHVWRMALAAGAAGFAAAWLGTPHGREIGAAWQLLLKLFAFACLCCAIAFFPAAPGRPQHRLLYLPFIFFTGYVIPRISWFYYGDAQRSLGGAFYTHLYLLLYPGIVLTVTAAYRLGGGTPGRCLKIAATGMVLVFSGFLDLMWFLVNPVGIPAAIDAPHITLLTGRPLSFGETVLFAAAHLPILLAIELLPLDRWIGHLIGGREAAGGRHRGGETADLPGADGARIRR